MTVAGLLTGLLLAIGQPSPIKRTGVRTGPGPDARTGMASRVLRGLASSLLCLLTSLTPARGDPLPALAIGLYQPVIRDVPRQDVEVSMRYWFEELAKDNGVSVKPIEFYDDLGKLRRDVASGRINFIVATCMGVTEHFSLDELAEGFSGYKALPDHLLLVVRRDASVRGPADLAGKRVALLKDDEVSQIYLETLLLRAWGKSALARLGPVSHEQRAGKLVHRLFFGQADAALISRNAYEAALALNPQIGQRLEVLEAHTFRMKTSQLGLFSSRMPAGRREWLIQAAIRLNDSARGRQVLQIYQVDRFARTPLSVLEPFRELLAEHRALKAGAASSGDKKAMR